MVMARHTRTEVAWRGIGAGWIPKSILDFWIAFVGGIGSEPGFEVVGLPTPGSMNKRN